MMLAEPLLSGRFRALQEMGGDGGRLFDMNSRRRIALNKTGFFIATLLLQGKDRRDIAKAARRKFRGARRAVVEEDIDALIRVLEDVADGGGSGAGALSQGAMPSYRWDAPLEMPFTVYWEVTEACNLRCQHCYTASGQRRSDELTTAECIALIEEMSGGGVCEIVVGGGEPFMRPDMTDLIAAMHNAGMAVVLVSNGTLMTRDLVGRIRDAGLAQVTISLDGPDPETHNRVRGNDTAFQRTLEGIRLLRAAGIGVSAQTVVSKLNKDGLPRIAALARELGAQSWDIIALHPLTRTPGQTDLALDAADVRRVSVCMEDIARRHADGMRVDPRYPLSFTVGGTYRRADKPSRRLGCGPGIETAGLTADGRLLTCSFIRGPGWMSDSIREGGFTHQWRRSPIFDAFRTLDSARLSDCGSCALLFDGCQGGCRARAFEATGDFYARDPLCFLD